MNVRIAKTLASLAIAAGCLALGTPARANLTVTLHDVNTGLTQTYTAGVSGHFVGVGFDVHVSGIADPGGSLLVSGTFGHFGIKLSATDNNPGTPNPTGGQTSDAFGTTVKNVGGALSDSLVATLNDTAFTTPGGPTDKMLLDSNLTVNSLTGTHSGPAAGASFNSTFTSLPNTVTSSTVSITGYSTSSRSVSSPTVPTQRNGNYDLSSVLTITLQSGDTITTQGNTIATNVVPVPATALLALTGVPFFGLLRRRRAAK
jgi:hypothetical protein